MIHFLMEKSGQMPPLLVVFLLARSSCLHSISVLQVLVDVRSLKHGNVGVGVLEVWNLECAPLVLHGLALGAIPGHGMVDVRKLELNQDLHTGCSGQIYSDNAAECHQQ